MKGANNTNLNVGTLYNLPPNARRSWLGHIRGLATTAGGAALGLVKRTKFQISVNPQLNFNVPGVRRSKSNKKNNSQPTTAPSKTRGFGSNVVNAIRANEAIAAQHRNHWNGANESERPVSLAGALPGILGGAAISGFTSAKRAHNLGQAARTGFYPASVLRYPVR
jgi:hypothetical protein